MPQIAHETLRNAVAEALGELTGYSSDKIVDTHDIVNDLGVDSMSYVSLLAAIEDRVGSVLLDGAEGRLVGVRTVGDLVECLASTCPAP